MFKTDKGTFTHKIKDGHHLESIFPKYNEESDSLFSEIKIENDYEKIIYNYFTHNDEINIIYKELESIDSKMCKNGIITISNYNSVDIEDCKKLELQAHTIKLESIDKRIILKNISSSISSLYFKSCCSSIDVYPADSDKSNIKKIVFEDNNQIIEIPEKYQFNKIYNKQNKIIIIYSNEYETVNTYLDTNFNIIGKEIYIYDIKSYGLKSNNQIILNECNQTTLYYKDESKCIDINMESCGKNNFMLYIPGIFVEKLTFEDDKINTLEPKTLKTICIFQKISCIFKIDNYIVLSNNSQNIIITKNLDVYRFNDATFMEKIKLDGYPNLINETVKVLKGNHLYEEDYIDSYEFVMKKYNLTFDELLELYNIFNSLTYKELYEIKNKQLTLK